jgi:hypothetical protein
MEIMNIGHADWESFQTYGDKYKMSLWVDISLQHTTPLILTRFHRFELSTAFEDSYISMIKAIRTIAYPTTPSIPIFIMRPFRGQLEEATRSVVERLRFGGDKAVFVLHFFSIATQG